jgi:hypothetical protein
MGREATCEARWAGGSSTGRARLEEKEIVFRGDFRLKIPFARIQSVEARGGRLVLETTEGRAELTLGAEAARWAERIRNPPSRLEKLGLKPGLIVSVVGLDDAAFRRELAARGIEPVTRPRKGSNVVVVRMDAVASLARLAALREAIAPDGAIWVVWPKGRKELREDDVRREAERVGLVDVKVASFSEELSALKLVIPRSKRPRP